MPVDQADLVFTGGRVLSGSHPRAVPVAVHGGRITGIGEDQVRPQLGPRTEPVDLAGRLLIPGFQDAHVHAAQAGLALTRCNLAGITALDEVLQAVSAYARANPDREWVLGGGWSMETFPHGTPHRRLLDGIVADRPVLLVNRDGHGAWVNTRALELAGVDRDTPDPTDGRIERDEQGEPQGTLHEGAARLIGDLTPPASRADRLRGLLLAQSHLHSLGVTAWQDALLGDYLGWPDPTATYLEAAETGRLTARVIGALWWDRERGAEQIPELCDRRQRQAAGNFRPTTVKIMQDGVAENFTAAMTDPYLDGCGCASANRGISFVDPEALALHVTRLDAEGFQVHFHAIGDRAVREVLDALAAARRVNGSSDNRHHVAHLQVVHPGDVARFSQLGVTATVQPLWAAHEPQMDELTIPFLGPERTAWQYPFAALHASGARLAAGSDWPVSSPDPLHGIHVAVNRTLPDDPHAEPFLPEQRVDLATALTAYTAGSAYVNHLDGATGTIEVGKIADLVVLDRDPFDASAAEIAAARVDLTFVEGACVYARG